jgi:hypothetical protein
MSLVAAGACFGLGRTASYRAARAGHFPVEVIRVGGRIRVATALVVDALGLQDWLEPAREAE